MNPTTLILPPDILAELQAAAERAARGERDSEAARRSCARMNRMREE
jgi:hypothetical protein